MEHSKIIYGHYSWEFWEFLEDKKLDMISENGFKMDSKMASRIDKLNQIKINSNDILEIQNGQNLEW